MQEPHLPGGRDPPVGVTNPRRRHSSSSTPPQRARNITNAENKVTLTHSPLEWLKYLLWDCPLFFISIFHKRFAPADALLLAQNAVAGAVFFPPHQKRGNFLLTHIVICGILIKRLRDTVRRSGGTGRRPGLKIPWEEIPVPVRPRSSAPNDLELCSKSFFVEKI